MKPPAHGKDYQSILLVQGKRVPAKRTPGRPAAGAPAPKSVVVHETLAKYRLQGWATKSSGS